MAIGAYTDDLWAARLNELIQWEPQWAALGEGIRNYFGPDSEEENEAEEESQPTPVARRPTTRSQSTTPVGTRGGGRGHLFVPNPLRGTGSGGGGCVPK